MAKCTRCGRKGMFLKVTNGLCDNCLSVISAEEQCREVEARLNRMQAEAATNLAKIKEETANQSALYYKISEKARADALESLKTEVQALTEKRDRLKAESDAEAQRLDEISTKLKTAERTITGAAVKVRQSRELIKAIKNSVDLFNTEDRVDGINKVLTDTDAYLSPTVPLELQCYDIKALQKKYKQNEQNIQNTFRKYKVRYTTKTNIAIYRLMVIALSAELQNVLSQLSFGKLDEGLDSIKGITEKYYAIAVDGNQSIAPTMKKFIGELDYFFQEAVRIEYEYHVQKERIREEQRAIREQMRQEAEERKELERQQKKIEKEEQKFSDQIAQIQAKIAESTDDEATKQLKLRIEELEQQLNNVAVQKEKIIQLQNGKAGNVYVISNIGSFGDGVFKIGMTRRSDPMERVRELGDASVPFPFDVHSIIFSDDAPTLENQLHKILNDKRLNKVNLRKEFFRIDLDELEKLVFDLSPTAAFKRTALAEQYRQSMSITHINDGPAYSGDFEDEDEDEAEASA